MTCVGRVQEIVADADAREAEGDRQMRPVGHLFVVVRIRRARLSDLLPIDDASRFALGARRRSASGAPALGVGDAVVRPELALRRVDPQFVVLVQPLVHRARQREMDLRVVARGLADRQHTDGFVVLLIRQCAMPSRPGQPAASPGFMR